MDRDARIRDLAERQHGVLARRQLTWLDDQGIQRRISSGMLAAATTRVLRLRGAPQTGLQEAMIAVLHVGPEAHLSHTSAAALWGIAGFALRPLHVAVQRDRHWEEEAPATVHHATNVPSDHVKVLECIPIASPALTLFQLAGMLHPERLERAVDNAWSLRLVDGRTLHLLLPRLARSGRNGIRAMRKILRARDGFYVPPQSNIESRFLDLMNRVSIGPFRVQVDIGDEEWTGRVDFLDTTLPLVVEIQSERYHTALSDRRRDQERRSRLEREGFTVVEVWDRELFLEGDAVADRIMEARRRLLAPTGGSWTVVGQARPP